MTITVSEYATRYGCSSQYVASQLRSGKIMSGMLGYRKIEGKTSSWLIEVNLEWYEAKSCDVCGSTDLVEYPSMGMNCENCHPVKTNNG